MREHWNRLLEAASNLNRLEVLILLYLIAVGAVPVLRYYLSLQDKPAEDPLAAFTTTITGRLIDEEGRPRIHCKVTLRDEELHTGCDGRFRFEKVSLASAPRLDYVCYRRWDSDDDDVSNRIEQKVGTNPCKKSDVPTIEQVTGPRGLQWQINGRLLSPMPDRGRKEIASLMAPEVWRVPARKRSASSERPAPFRRLEEAPRSAAIEPSLPEPRGRTDLGDIVVGADLPEHLEVHPKRLQLTPGTETAELQVYGVLASGERIDLSGDLKGTYFYSSRPDTISVDRKGFVRALAPGSATVSAVWKGLKDNARVAHSTGAFLVSHRASVSTTTLEVGQITRLRTQGFFSDATTSEITGATALRVSSSDPEILRISPSSLIHAVRKGEASIVVAKGTRRSAIPFRVLGPQEPEENTPSPSEAPASKEDAPLPEFSLSPADGSQLIAQEGFPARFDLRAIGEDGSVVTTGLRYATERTESAWISPRGRLFVLRPGPVVVRTWTPDGKKTYTTYEVLEKP